MTIYASIPSWVSGGDIGVYAMHAARRDLMSNPLYASVTVGAPGPQIGASGPKAKEDYAYILALRFEQNFDPVLSTVEILITAQIVVKMSKNTEPPRKGETKQAWPDGNAGPKNRRDKMLELQVWKPVVLAKEEADAFGTELAKVIGHEKGYKVWSNTTDAERCGDMLEATYETQHSNMMEGDVFSGNVYFQYMITTQVDGKEFSEAQKLLKESKQTLWAFPNGYDTPSMLVERVFGGSKIQNEGNLDNVTPALFKRHYSELKDYNATPDWLMLRHTKKRGRPAIDPTEALTPMKLGAQTISGAVVNVDLQTSVTQKSTTDTKFGLTRIIMSVSNKAFKDFLDTVHTGLANQLTYNIQNTAISNVWSTIRVKVVKDESSKVKYVHEILLVHPIQATKKEVNKVTTSSWRPTTDKDTKFLPLLKTVSTNDGLTLEGYFDNAVFYKNGDHNTTSAFKIDWENADKEVYIIKTVKKNPEDPPFEIREPKYMEQMAKWGGRVTGRAASPQAQRPTDSAGAKGGKGKKGSDAAATIKS